MPDLIRKTVLGYRPRSRYAGFVLNSRSLRTPEYTAEKPSDVFRIVTWTTGPRSEARAGPTGSSIRSRASATSLASFEISSV